MKRKSLLLWCVSALAFLLGFTSCIDEDNAFCIGEWAVEKVEYYTADIYGNPIEGTIEENTYDVAADRGIHFVFEEGGGGAIVYKDDNMVTLFSYEYDTYDNLLYMTLQGDDVPLCLEVDRYGASRWSYKNIMEANKVEKTYLVKM